MGLLQPPDGASGGCGQQIEAGAGVEPAHGGFADRSVTTSPSGHKGIIPRLELKCWFVEVKGVC